MTAMKLQKLVYYSQAWSVVWEGRALFDARIEAWSNGPVVPELYAVHRGQFMVAAWPLGDSGKLGAEDQGTVVAVCDYYGDKSPQWLSDLTHAEDPWRNARQGIPEGERGSVEITLAALEEYYTGLQDRG
jgi:uncharacterized phage-associated protein